MQCFSAVVGPNGSGKSNVIDALLFVFGFRAKKIRQAKLKDLIHKSEGHIDIDSCRVSIFFQEVVDQVRSQPALLPFDTSRVLFLSPASHAAAVQPDGSFTVLPGSELEVMREATDANQSNYYVNGRKSNFKDVGILLREKGIDLDHNRFLILQGEVESIAMMKPKAQTENDDGLLEYLEDIVGCASNLFSDVAVASPPLPASQVVPCGLWGCGNWGAVVLAPTVSRRKSPPTRSTWQSSMSNVTRSWLV